MPAKKVGKKKSASKRAVKKRATKKRAAKKKASRKKAPAKKTAKLPAERTRREVFVIDANFFICLKDGGRFSFHLAKFGKFAKEKGLLFTLSSQVFKELPWVKGSLADKFREMIPVKSVDPAEVDAVKGRLVKMGFRVPAQDPDLSLVVLAKRAVDAGDKAYLVSDDFKLSQNVTSLGFPIEFLSLGAFVLKLQNLATGELRQYFKAVRKKLLSYTINYALSRQKEYDVSKKISWMIERAVAVAGSSLRFEDEVVPEGPIAADEDLKDELKACHDYLRAAKPTPKLGKRVAAYMPHLEEIRGAREDVARAQRLLAADQTAEAKENLTYATQRLSDTFQLASASLKGRAARAFNVLICSELSKIEFVTAFLHLNEPAETDEEQEANIREALNRLDRAALFSTIAQDTRSILTLNYTKSIILVFSGRFEDAFRQYDFTTNLALAYGERSLELKCKIGKAITMYLYGEGESAEAMMDLVSMMTAGQENVEHLQDAQLVLNEIGDYFYTLDRPEIALALYDESLECAVDAGLEHKISSLVEKIKRSTLAAAFRGYSGDSGSADSVIDKAYDVKDVDRYNEAIAKISEIHALFYQDFPYYTKKNKWDGFFDLPEELEPLTREMELIEIKKLAKGTLFVSYLGSLGLVGFILPEKGVVHGIPENYTVQLNKNAKFKVQRLSEELKSKYLIRAIVRLKDAAGLDVNRHVPGFFAQIQM
ncbi:MAG: hypothetical protein ACTSU5_10885 [Promethearchaeota archaeon]